MALGWNDRCTAWDYDLTPPAGIEASDDWDHAPLPDVDVLGAEDAPRSEAEEPDHYDNGSEWVDAETSAAPEAEHYEYPDNLDSQSSAASGEAEYAAEYYGKYGYEYGYEYAYPEDKYAYDAAGEAPAASEEPATTDSAPANEDVTADDESNEPYGYGCYEATADEDPDSCRYETAFGDEASTDEASTDEASTDEASTDEATESDSAAVDTCHSDPYSYESEYSYDDEYSDGYTGEDANGDAEAATEADAAPAEATGSDSYSFEDEYSCEEQYSYEDAYSYANEAAAEETAKAETSYEPSDEQYSYEAEYGYEYVSPEDRYGYDAGTTESSPTVEEATIADEPSNSVDEAMESEDYSDAYPYEEYAYPEEMGETAGEDSAEEAADDQTSADAEWTDESMEDEAVEAEEAADSAEDMEAEEATESTEASESAEEPSDEYGYSGKYEYYMKETSGAVEEEYWDRYGHNYYYGDEAPASSEDLEAAVAAAAETTSSEQPATQPFEYDSTGRFEAQRHGEPGEAVDYSTEASEPYGYEYSESEGYYGYEYAPVTQEPTYEWSEAAEDIFADAPSSAAAAIESGFELFAAHPADVLADPDAELLRALAKLNHDVRPSMLGSYLNELGPEAVDFASRFEAASGIQVAAVADDVPGAAALLGVYRLVERGELTEDEGMNLLRRSLACLALDWINSVNDLTADPFEVWNAQAAEADAGDSASAHPVVDAMVWVALRSLNALGGALRNASEQLSDVQWEAVIMAAQQQAELQDTNFQR